ncbi:hypothetical protein [Actinokineospora sp.]|uniref:hypothetical protein n=1 Tax=Actinokineospora sp. TaxID=1872133 RepID=UPI0040383784
MLTVARAVVFGAVILAALLDSAVPLVLVFGLGGLAIGGASVVPLPSRLGCPRGAGLSRPSPAEPGEPGQLLVLLCVGAAFIGGAAAAREVISERAIFVRERAAGLRPGAHVVAKAAVFGVVCLIQATTLTTVVFSIRSGPADAVVFGWEWWRSSQHVGVTRRPPICAAWGR